MKIANILVTGVAGFIGSSIAKKLLKEGYKVFGIDNLNSYYSISLKNARLDTLLVDENFVFIKMDISDKPELMRLFNEHNFDLVIHLAAQAGVRHSISNPDSYITSNIIGMFNILEACRNYPVKHLLYASSSSVYGSNTKVPFNESDFVDHPVSLYAATKKSNELMAHAYSHLYAIPTTGLRFFTVYGPMGRPDMAYYSFVNNYFENKPIHIFNNGDFENDMYRDFTYIDDIVEGIYRLMLLPPNNEENNHRILNIGNNHPEKLMIFIDTLEKCLSKSLAKKVEFTKLYEPIKPGDVFKTYADITSLNKFIEFTPKTSISEGLQKFTDWYVNYYGKK
jgi:UDP-glucuronate 4-epimerase